ncbi:MAG: T9SS type A sorting domain-containing protein [Calditrichaeota bacterium]|nr:T9SS type A sorting domain-containing protein [Calditrichota bacterium]
MQRGSAKKVMGVLWIILLVATSPIFAQYRIMPLGDSITEGILTGNPVGGYRDDLADLLTNGGYNFNFVGTQSDGTGFDADHEGHNGLRADEIADSLNIWLNQLGSQKPRFYLLHIGTNDISQDQSVESTINDITDIIEIIHNEKSYNNILLCSLIPRDDSKNSANSQLNDLIKDLYYTKRNQGYNIYYVGMNEVFTANSSWANDYMTDHVHPNNDGFHLMAEVFYNVLTTAFYAFANHQPIVADYFQRSTLGNTWVADPEYQIVDNKLSNTTETAAWGFMATYIAQTNPTRVVIQWDTTATTAGINEGAVALKLDAANANANGYMCWYSANGVRLWEVRNGEPYGQIDRQTSTLPAPQGGDVFEVEMFSDQDGHHFRCYINGVEDVTLTDPERVQGNSSTLYTGVMLKGALANDINYFDLLGAEQGGQPDETPPAAISDLSAGSPTGTTITLNWTAVGDDGNTGRAAFYDVRYSTSQIADETNFSNATQASGAPSPAIAGSAESFVVSGLSPTTTYYFRIKVSDEAGNTSDLSNSAEGTTTELSGDYFSDNFDRTDLGSSWSASGVYQIVNNELANTSTDYLWGNIAVCNAVTNPTEVSLRWGAGVDASGIEEGGFALMMDNASPTANGYFVWIRPSNSTINLYTIEGGSPGHRIGSAISMIAGVPAPQAGDVFKVRLSSDDEAHHFDCYLNDQYAGRISDTGKEQGNASSVFAGVNLRGNLNNNIDDFLATSQVLEDDVPPSAVTDLAIASVTSRSVTLNWTSVGDDGTSGTASSYDIRFSTSPIETDSDFNNADLVSDPPTPSQAGTGESFTVHGLQPNTTYYFAMKVIDDASNISGLSNVVNGTTPESGGSQFVDDFERADLGPNWTADPEYQIVDGELANTVTVDGWEYLAVFKGQKDVAEVSIQWGTGADANGIEQGGLALMMDTTSTEASGYALWIRPSNRTLNLFRIDNGVVTSRIGSAVAMEGDAPTPQAGSVFKVQISTNDQGHHFDCFVDDVSAGRISDPSKLLGNAADTYAGVVLRGNLNNNVDNFTVSSPLGFLEYVSGNNQSGPIGSVLPEPLVVLIKDADQIPIIDETVTFSVVTGEATLSPVDKIGFEAESGTLTPNMQIGNDSNASGNLYIYAPTGEPYQGKAEYTFNVQQPGNYIIWTRIYAPSGQEDSFFFVVDDSPDTVLFDLMNPYNVWRWKKLEDRNKGIFQTSLSEGTHKISVIKRENNARLDKMIITSDLAFTPSGFESGASSVEVTTNSDGNAGVYTSLGSTIGSIVVRADAAGYQGSPVEFNLATRGGDAVRMEYVSGDGQSGRAGEALTNPFVVQLFDVGNNPVQGWPVTFQDIQGGGFPSTSQPVLTDDNGRASTIWTLGTENPTNIVHAISEGLAGSPIEFQASATSGLADSLVYISGNGQSGSVGQQLSAPLKVRVVDLQGEAVKNHHVLFRVTRGGGSLSGAMQLTGNLTENALLNEVDVLTDANGYAQAIFTLGDTAGVENQIVEVTSSFADSPLKGSPLLFKASANAGDPVQIMVVSGNNQTGATNHALGSPFVVKVADQFGNGVVGHPVVFEVKQGGGSLSPQGPWYTEAGGLASVTLTLGSQSGQTNEVWASSSYNSTPLTNSPVVFQATSGEVAAIQYVSGSGQTGSAGYPVSDSLKVKVLDNFGNPVSGYPVTFTSEGTTNPGTFNGTGNSIVVVNTEGSGIAKAQFYCGSQYGVQSTAQAVADGLNGSPINFTINVADLAGLEYVSGNGQTGVVAAPLAEPFKVQVVDALGKSIPSYNVTFTVKSGNGNFAGKQSVTVSTDAQTHVAAATLTLGPAPGTNNNVAEASAVYKGNPLGTPITFTSSATPGSAHELVQVSGNYGSGVVGNQLENPFIAKVVDTGGNPIVNHPVLFTVKSGGGTLDGFTQTSVTKNTGTDGKVLVYLTLGLTAGINNNSVEAVSYKPNSTNHLLGSPTTFYASGLSSPATQLTYVSGNAQAPGFVREALPQPLRVKVTDNHNNPVPEHPVSWKSVVGGGTFDNLTDTTKTVLSDQNGIAQVTFYPGPVAGVRNQAIAQSWNGPELSGSPITFFIDTKAGTVSATNSEVTTTGPIPADGATTSTITVTLKDGYGNPIAGKALSLLVSGSNNNITPFTALTDANGQSVAYLASTRAEVKTLTIIDMSDGITLGNTAQVQFTPLAASSISYISGTNQTSNYGTACKDPIEARVTDMHGNVIAHYPVFFEAYVGGGYIYEQQPIYTDSSGIALAHWVLGTSGEVNRARAKADGLSGTPIEYIATAKSGVASIFNYVSGDDQTGTAGYPLPNPLTVSVTDNQGDPIANYSVTFNIDFGGGNFEGNTSLAVYTDVFGNAKASFTLGRVAGPNIASVTAEGLSGSPKRFTAMGVSGPAQKIVKYYGDGSNISVNSNHWVKVKVTDIFDNPVSGYDVLFSVIKGDATIVSGYETATSDADGIAGSLVRAGYALEEIQILATAPGMIGDGLRFKLNVVARSAVAMEIYHGNNQEGTIGRELVYPLSVILKDEFGNPAGGQNIPITFSLVGEKGILLDSQPVYSDANGIASTRLKLEDATGDKYKVWAIKNGLTGSPLEFTAFGVTNKFPLFDAIPDYTILENQTVSFYVRATDDDGDPITYGVRNLPAGASFDSLGTRQFSWHPDYFAAGEYTVHFMAWDNKGGFDDEPVKIVVENVNRLPQIINYEPIAFQVVGHKSIGEIFRFMVQVVDADNDEISYEWYNNGVLVSTKNYYDCDVTAQTLKSHIIKVKVSDGFSDPIEHEWALYVKTPVELADFSGEVEVGKGIRLKWETGSEANHAGFNLFRKEEGGSEYKKINDMLIRPDGTRQYEFFDRQVKVGKTYLYKLEDVSLTGSRTQHESISIFVEKPVSFELSQNYPNPFNALTQIRYQLPEQSVLSIKIYNILGQEVRTLVDGVKEAGYHTVIWNGLDNFNRPVSSGIYYYRFKTATFVQTRKMVFLK